MCEGRPSATILKKLLLLLLLLGTAGLDAGGVIAGLAVCGVVFAGVSTASDLMQDFRTGWVGMIAPLADSWQQLSSRSPACLLPPIHTVG